MLYGFMVLLAVTNPDDDSDMSQPLVQLNSRYHILLKRRIFATSNTNSGKLQEDPNHVLAKVYASFAKLKTLAHLLKPFLK